MKEYTVDDMIYFVTARIAELCDVPIAGIDPDANMLDLGLDSLRSVHLIGEIEDWIDRQIPVESIFDFKTIREFSGFIHQEVAANL